MSELQRDIRFWQLSNELEEGRNHVLKMVARNEDLNLILKTLCQKAQVYNPDMLCSILRLNRQKNTLHPVASVSLPDFYCQALDGVEIGAGVGSCGTAAYSKKRVIVEDINTHPYWSQYKSLALSAGVQACWSEPIIGANGIVFGTFAMYYAKPTSPTCEDLKFIELSANLAAVVFENHSNREKLLNANNLLSQTVNDRNRELERVNLALEKVIKEQSQRYSLDIRNEKMLTTNNLIAGFSHEINGPIGVALTAISAAEDKLNILIQEFTAGKLTRRLFVAKTSELSEVIEINKTSLLRANNLLQRFKDVNTFADLNECKSFSMQSFLEEVKVSVEGILGCHKLTIQCEDFVITSQKECLWQVLFNLIENSVIHAFKGMEIGAIFIRVVEHMDEVVINYHDNGCGISEDKTAKIFEPFYTSSRNNKSLGLGLNIINNIVNHNLRGRVRLVDSPVGVRYEIILPRTSF